MPEDPKVTEMRDRNVALMKENDALTKQIAEIVAKYDGIDPDEFRTLKARVAAGSDTEVAALRTELATEKAARLAVEQRAETTLVETKIADLFLKAGGRPEARSFVVAQAAGLFTLDKGELRGVKASPDRPGARMSVEEFVTLQSRQNPFAFLPSSGGGADPGRSGSATSRLLRNPTPQDLGRHATEIASGELRIVYE